MFKLRMYEYVQFITNTQLDMVGSNFISVPLVGLEQGGGRVIDYIITIDRFKKGGVIDYDFMKQHYISHKMKYVSPLRVAALTCKQYNHRIASYTGYSDCRSEEIVTR